MPEQNILYQKWSGGARETGKGMGPDWAPHLCTRQNSEPPHAPKNRATKPPKVRAHKRQQTRICDAYACLLENCPIALLRAQNTGTRICVAYAIFEETPQPPRNQGRICDAYATPQIPRLFTSFFVRLAYASNMRPPQIPRLFTSFYVRLAYASHMRAPRPARLGKKSKL